MIIIAEKLNGSIPSCAKAIAARDEAYIKDMAKRQADAGAAFIDCCASVNEGELETLKWMIDNIQSATDCPISVDSPAVSVVIDAMQFCERPGLFNSVSGEGGKIDIAFPILAKPENSKWQVMALLCDDTGIPKTAAKRIEVFDMTMAKAKEYGIDESRIHIDPLVEMLCTTDDGEGISMVLEVMSHIKTTHPKVHISGAISNISFNLPVRRLVNQAFATLAISAGMDSSVMDPLSQDLRGIIYAAEAMMGQDDFCAEYTSAYREGIFGAK
ncbi:MAG: dihydropteroate synthase [Oscillospiraceae bacterium]|jgi:5-methyltetrahydrofolate--homocysteine methyltransferase|nr:dihydropteroate synthase [Oscillospiraceae bacterium]